MTDITFIRTHSLSIAKAKALVQKTVDGLADEYDLRSEWHGNTLHFDRAGIHGQMHVSDSEIRLHVTLGLLLKPFKGKLIDHIERSFNKLLPKREPRVQAGEPAGKPDRKTAHSAG
jgi:putative polyhydroxyalkanoate system protein